jgi:glycosyltransferase involved in cell wall biosynthesis
MPALRQGAVVERDTGVSVDVSVVIPLYNEEANVRPLCSRLCAVLGALPKTWEVIVVDDGSTDGSFAALQELARKEGRLKVVRFRRNFGQTAAFAAGFELA